MDRPGAVEAKAIQRNFQWNSKLREINKRLEVVSCELNGGTNLNSLPRLNPQKFDAENTINTIEGEARKAWEDSPPPISKERYVKLRAALDSLSRKQEAVPVASSSSTPSGNEWSSFAKAEEERRAFLEATYRRFRLGPVPEISAPNRESFDYEHVDFSLPSGEKVQQPVAYVRTEAHINSDLRDRYRSSSNAFTVGVNTECTLVDVDQPAREPCGLERDAFVSQLISRTSQKDTCLAPGQRVSVSYFGVYFAASVVKRNVGSATFTVRFDDGTVNDFPLHAIIQK
jgi:hypothetical protein